MKTLKSFIAMLLCISLCASLTQAQPAPDKRQDAQATNTIAQDVLIIIQQEQVRFTARSAVAEMQLQIFDQAGQLVYDSGAVTGQELTWVLRQANGEAVKSGLYAYTLSIKEVGKEAGAADARVRRGHFIVDRASERDGQTDRLWITSQNDSGVGTELTVARNEGVTIAGTSATSESKSVQVAKGAPRNGASESKNENNVAAAEAANGTTGFIAKFGSPTELTNSVMTELNGNIGIWTPAPKHRLSVSGGPTWTSNGWRGALDLENAAAIAWRANISGHRFGLGHTNGGLFFFRTASDPGTAGSAANYDLMISDAGNVGVGTTAPNGKLEVTGNWNNQHGALTLSGDKPTIRFSGGAISGSQQWLLHQGSDGGGNLQFFNGGTTGAWSNVMSLAPNGNVGIGTTNPLARLHVQGATMTSVLQITGGADFAENFDVNLAATGSEAATATVEAGSVVSIDPASPGKLALSMEAYDRRVAGIVSGAGGVKPGMIMSQEGTLADGKHSVALSGRVYCWVDASHGAIEPGDLLTTSRTPGHAMKAADAMKAQGAIIGKAMTGLKEGKGLVLVLVTLQ